MANVISRALGGLDEIKKGLGTVFKHTFREPITKNYPDEVSKLSPHFRGRLALAVNPESGENLCIACRQCERVCPDKCIEITSHKDPETNKLQLLDFKIDHGLCMFCGLCTEVCPTNCIINTNDFEMADYTRSSLIYDLKKLTLGQDESAFYFEAKGMPLPKPKPVKAAAPAAGAAPAAAKPAADAAAKPAADAAVKPAADAAGKATAEAPAAKAAVAAKPADGDPTKPPVSAKPAADNTDMAVKPAENSAVGKAASGPEGTTDKSKDDSGTVIPAGVRPAAEPADETKKAEAKDEPKSDENK